MPRRAAVVVLLVVFASTAAGAQELRGRVRETFQTIETDGERLDSVLQNYELSYKNYVTSNLYWQARLRALLTGFDDTRPAAPTDSALVEPFLQVVYESGDWRLGGGGRLTRVSPKGDLSQFQERERQDLFGSAGWSPFDHLNVDVSAYSIDLREDDQDISTESRAILTTAYSGSPGNLSLGLETRQFEDMRSNFTRDSVQATGNAGTRRSFAGGRVVLTGQVLAVRGRTTEEIPVFQNVLTLRIPRNGLFDIDTNPLTGTLADTPALIDGDLASPAADLSGDFRNLGADLGFDRSVDEIWVYVERALLPGSPREYRWDVYVSNDGDFWNLQVKNASFRFEPLRNRFELAIPTVTTRFIKVVNTDFSRNEPPLAATELEILGLESRVGREISDNTQQNANFGASWRAAKPLDFSLHTVYSRQTNDRRGLFTEDRDFNSTLTSTLRPVDKVVTSLRLQAVNRNTTQRPGEQDRLAALTVSVTPMPALDFAVIGTARTNSSLDEKLATTDSLQLRTAVRLRNETQASLDVGFIQQGEPEIDRETDRRSVQVALVSKLRPGLFWTNTWAGERILTDGAGVEASRTDLDLRSRVSYRPTPVLGLSYEYFYQKLSGIDGTSWLYDIDWLPFPGGALQFQLSVLKDRRSITGSLRDETRAAIRWNLNPKALLETAYTQLKVGTGAANEQHILSAFLEYRF